MVVVAGARLFGGKFQIPFLHYCAVQLCFSSLSSAHLPKVPVACSSLGEGAGSMGTVIPISK